MQHWQQLRGVAERLLGRLGYELTPVPDAHACCGSAGTYSITQPELAEPLKRQKLAALQSGMPDAILTANVGCQAHLATAASVPVRHWVVDVEARLRAA
jgi:glycolate oxidase iron-sulfur subunit